MILIKERVKSKKKTQISIDFSTLLYRKYLIEGLFMNSNNLQRN